MDRMEKVVLTLPPELADTIDGRELGITQQGYSTTLDLAKRQITVEKSQGSCYLEALFSGAEIASLEAEDIIVEVS